MIKYNRIVDIQINKVVNDKTLPHVQICSCGHSSYYHLDYLGTCYAEQPENIKDHERYKEKMVQCTCKKFDLTIDTSLKNMIVVTGVFKS